MLCSERKTFEAYRHTDEPSTKPSIAPAMPFYQSEENWDDDADAPTYNPLAYVANAPVIRNLQGASRGERKKFREQERLRILELNK